MRKRREGEGQGQAIFFAPSLEVVACSGSGRAEYNSDQYPLDDIFVFCNIPLTYAVLPLPKLFILNSHCPGYSETVTS